MLCRNRPVGERRRAMLETIGLANLGDCRVRFSPKSSAIRFTFSPTRGLTVVTPTRLSDEALQRCLERHRRWLETLPPRIDILTELRNTETLVFPALNQRRTLHVISDAATRNVSATATDHELRLSGSIDDETAVKTAFRRWLSRQADQALSPAFAVCAAAHGFPTFPIRWRIMRSRWGSCVSTGKISLNAALLFLPRSLIDYVFLHELCHTRVMNHGPDFYDALGRCLPDYRARERDLKRRSQTLPSWLRLL